MTVSESSASEPVTADRRRELYERQVELLRLFLERGAITPAQYDKSYGDLTEKMGYGEKSP